MQEVLPTLSSAVQKPPCSVQDNRRIDTRQCKDFRLKIYTCFE